MNAKFASVIWTLEGPPGAMFDESSGVVWNTDVKNPPGAPRRVKDTQWILDDDNPLVNGDSSVKYKYTINVKATKDSPALPSTMFLSFDPEVENDPVTGHPEPLPKPHSY